MNDFKGRHFGGEVVLWEVRWYCRYGISYRNLETMMAECGVRVAHNTIYRWVQRYAPEKERRMRWQWRRLMADSWLLDQTDIKFRGKWTYLYRAVDKHGNTIDFYLSSPRNAKAAINTNKAGCYTQAIRELKKEGMYPKDVEQRQVNYLNNVIEADHGNLKKLIKPVRGLRTMKTAYATIKGSKVMRALQEGQAMAFHLTLNPLPQRAIQPHPPPGLTRRRSDLPYMPHLQSEAFLSFLTTQSNNSKGVNPSKFLINSVAGAISHKRHNVSPAQAAPNDAGETADNAAAKAPHPPREHAIATMNILRL